VQKLMSKPEIFSPVESIIDGDITDSALPSITDHDENADISSASVVVQFDARPQPTSSYPSVYWRRHWF